MARPHEIDSLVITQLKQFGCDIDDDITSIQQFDKRLLFHCAVIGVRLLCTLQQKTPEDYPSSLPSDMASCFRVCSALAGDIERMGYREKLQFDQFLYPSESSSRRLLSWVSEQVSSLKASDETEDVEGGKSSGVSLQQRIQSSLLSLSKSTWTVPNAMSSGVQKSAFAIRQYHEKRRFQSYPINTFLSSETMNKYEQMYDSNFKPLVSLQVYERHQLAPSIFEDNTRDLVASQLKEETWNNEGIDSGLNRNEFEANKSNKVLNLVSQALAASKRSVQQNYSKNIMNNVLKKIVQNNINAGDLDDSEFANAGEEGEFQRRVRYETDQDLGKQVAQQKENPEEEEKRRLQEIEDLQNYLTKVGKAINHIKDDMERVTNSIRQTEEELDEERIVKKDSEEKYTTIMTSVKLLQDKDKNMKELKRISDMSAAKLIELATEWETHRKPMIEKIRLIKSQDHQNKNTAKVKVEQAKKNRETMRQMITDIKQKEELIARLKKEYDELPKNVDRSLYVTRILDVVKNVEKQTREINKIMGENKQLHKQIATTSDVLSRTFREVEEMIYKDAQTNESSKKVYKAVLTMREQFENIINNVQETGNSINSIRDMETQIERIIERQDSMNMERVANDLKIIKEENNRLLEQLRQ
jgi:hypothetical protein